MGDRITKRGGVWHYARRVPRQFASLDRRGVIRVSTKIKVSADRTGIRALEARNGQPIVAGIIWN